MNLLAIYIKSGPEDFMPARPNWDAVSFAGPLVKWLFGVFMALIIVFCLYKALTHLAAIGGAGSTHRAKEGGIGLAFAGAAIVGVYFFSDLFTGLISSAV